MAGNTTSSLAPDLPCPPFSVVPNINNLRDAALGIAEWRPVGGVGQARLRRGVLWRSADVGRVDAAGWETLKGLGVKHVFDLRSKPEVDKGWAALTGDRSNQDVKGGWEDGMRAAGVIRTWVPVFEETDYSPERLSQRYAEYMGESDQGFVRAYHDILTHAGPAYRKIFLYLASMPPQKAAGTDSVGALVHCTAGKDRTGMFFGILFSLLGVPSEQIADEYQLTELGLADIHQGIVPRMLGSPVFKKYVLEKMAEKDLSKRDLPAGGEAALELKEEDVPPEIMEMAKNAAFRMLGARKESMLGALEMVRREWGGAEGYVRKVCGLEDADIEALKSNLIVGSQDLDTKLKAGATL